MIALDLGVTALLLLAKKYGASRTLLADSTTKRNSMPGYSWCKPANFMNNAIWFSKRFPKSV
jgi:hypothetical protein